MDPLLDLRIRILTCNRCTLSSQCRTPVPFSGPPAPTFLVVGEAPGRMEDYNGKPFVGPAGTLMRKSLERVGLNTDAAVFMNSVCCWPHGSPEPESIIACSQHLRDQLEVFPTPYTLLTGLTALHAILPHADLKQCMNRSFYLYDKIFFTVWHPSYINQNLHLRRVWTTHLSRFRDLVTSAYWDQPNGCLYCDHNSQSGQQVCTRHLAQWRRDIQWPAYNAQLPLL